MSRNKNITQPHKAVVKFFDQSRHGGAKGSFVAIVYDLQAFGETVGDTGYQLSYDRCREVAGQIAKGAGYKYVKYDKNIVR